MTFYHQHKEAGITMNEPRHILAITLNEHEIDVFFREGATVRCMSGVPADARFLGAATDFATRQIILHFEHASFPVCFPGAQPVSRSAGYEILQHPYAQLLDMIPLRIGMDEQEYLDMQRWICERAAEIEGRSH
jgi:hypothetical protein